MSENKKVMSMAIKPELHEKVVHVARLKGVSRSAYIGDLLEQAVKISHDEDPMVVGKPMDMSADEITVLKIPKDDNVQPIVLKMPKTLKDDPDKLKQWMASQMKGIYQTITKKADT